MSGPLVSVVMPVYNGASHLREAIESILSQSYEHFEFIVVNDGSTDDSPAIAKSYRDPRLRVIDLRHSLLKSVNTGLAVARGVYVARQDGDDVALPDRLGRQVAFLEAHAEVGVLGGAYVQMDENAVYQRTKRLESHDAAIKWQLLFCNAFRHTTVMCRRRILQDAGGYQWRYGDDYELWSRLSDRTRMANLGEPLAKVRVSSRSDSSLHRQRFVEAGTAISTRNLTNVLGGALELSELACLRMFHSSDNSLTRYDLLKRSQTALSRSARITRRLIERFAIAQGMSPVEKTQFTGWAYHRMSRRLLAIANDLVQCASHEPDWGGTRRIVVRLLAEAVSRSPRTLCEAGLWRLVMKSLAGGAIPAHHWPPPK